MFDLGHLPTLVWRNLTLSFQCWLCGIPLHVSSITHLSPPIGCAFWECPKIHFYKQRCNESTNMHIDIRFLCISTELLKMESLGQKSLCTFNVARRHTAKVSSHRCASSSLPSTVRKRNPVSQLATVGVIKCLNICQSGRWKKKII